MCSRNWVLPCFRWCWRGFDNCACDTVSACRNRRRQGRNNCGTVDFALAFEPLGLGQPHVLEAEGRTLESKLWQLRFVVVFLSISIPFTSTNPDRLERAAETFGVEEGFQLWGELMLGYSLRPIGNFYVTALAAGILGVAMVFLSPCSRKNHIKKRQKY